MQVVSNRELDERVARAMGWTITLSDTADPWQVKFERYRTLRAYSSDWSCCEEMLAWLRKAAGNIIMLIAEDGLSTVSNYRGLDRSATDAMAHCAALPEALARLVVAVAGAKEKKQ